MGRPPIELDTARRSRMLAALEAGASLKMAAAAAGVSEATLGRWRKARPELEEEMQQAEAAGAVRALGVIQQAAASGTWQAAAWLLERRYPGEYGRRVQKVDEAPDVIRSYLEASLARFNKLYGAPQDEGVTDAESDARLARLLGEDWTKGADGPTGLVRIPMEDTGPLIILPEKESRELPENPTVADVRAAQARVNERRNQGDGLTFS